MARVLDQVEGPEDLRRLDSTQLTTLATELRDEITQTVARTGGHLGANLGTVELTIALHRVSHSPEDMIVWDVGHQSYSHKLLTGRKAEFATLRQRGGLSGFPKRHESPHDVFGTGHSSTSISAALGFAKARDLDGEKYSVIAVIGDGALTGGMAFEALNQAGREKTRLIIVLNDNGMSISPNVGAMADYLSRIRTGPAYYRAKEDVESLLRRIPVVGPRVASVARRIKQRLKYLVVSGVLFEELGFTYLGPVDGHDIASLESVLRGAERVSGPSFVHVVTQKGRGYALAEKDPDIFHGPGPFDLETGLPNKPYDRPSYSAVFGETMVDMASVDPRIIAISAAMVEGTGLAEFSKRFPSRLFDVGIAEQHAITFAAALAAAGKRPVVALYSTFVQRAYDQINHDVCVQNLPVVIAIDRAGIVGEDGETHQGTFDISLLLPMPNISIMAPSSGSELTSMLRLAVESPGPVAIRYPRGPVPPSRPESVMSWGKAEVVEEGTDVAIMAVGHSLSACGQACALLKSAELKPSLLNLRFLKPLDFDAIAAFAESNRAVLVVEEGTSIGGVGSAILSELNRRGIMKRIVFGQLGIPDRFIEQGGTAAIRQSLGLDAAGIAETAANLSRQRTEI